MIHAYVVDELKRCIDIRGKLTKEQMIEGYDSNVPIYRPVTVEEVQGYMESGFLEPPATGEFEELQQFLMQNKHKYGPSH